MLKNNKLVRRVAGIFAMLSLVALDARAYVPSVTDVSKLPLSWHDTNCVKFRVDSAGAHDVSLPKTLDAIRRAAENWNKATAACSYMNIQIEDVGTNLKRAVNLQGKNENVIVWVENDWPHDPQAAGITSIQYIDAPTSEQDGRIVDTDIELNGGFIYSAAGEPNRTDIENTLTHELGHALGFDHPCDDGTRPFKLKDHLGKTIPSCEPMSALPREMFELTMFIEAMPGDTNKRSLEPDDILAACQTYPKENDPGVCQMVDLSDTGGCAVGAADMTAAASDVAKMLIFAGAIALVRLVRFGRWRRRDT